MEIRWIKILIGAILISAFYSLPVFAEVIYWEGLTIEIPEEDSELCPVGVQRSRGVGASTRADGFQLLFFGTCEMTNQGGKVGILLETIAQVPCDRIKHVVYVQMKNEEETDWNTVAVYEFEDVKENHEDQILTQLLNTLILEVHENKRYYRLKGIHAVWLNGKGEGKGSYTRGMLLE